MNPASFTPINRRVLLSPLASETVTAGGLVIPDNAHNPSHRAKIVAVHKDAMVSPGQTVMLGLYTGTPVELNGTSYLLVAEEDLLAVCDA